MTTRSFKDMSFFVSGGYSPAPWALPLLALARAAFGLASLCSDWRYFCKHLL